jgi:hypothetical protein
MPKGSIQAVCFDVGGVIVRIRHSWRELCRAAGFDLREAAGRDDSARREFATAPLCPAMMQSNASATPPKVRVPLMVPLPPVATSAPPAPPVALMPPARGQHAVAYFVR